MLTETQGMALKKANEALRQELTVSTATLCILVGAIDQLLSDISGLHDSLLECDRVMRERPVVGREEQEGAA